VQAMVPEASGVNRTAQASVPALVLRGAVTSVALAEPGR